MAKIDLLLAKYNLGHFVCVIVLIIYIFNVDVAGSVYFNVVADDLTVVTKIRIQSIDADICAGREDGPLIAGIFVAA